MMKKKISYIFLLVLVAVWCGCCAYTGNLLALEQQIARVINPLQRFSWFFYGFTWIGEYWVLIPLAGVWLLIPKLRQKVGIPIAVTVTVSYLANTLIKLLVARQRPAGQLFAVSGYSFPSGHDMNNAALYVGLMLFLLPLIENKNQRIGLGIMMGTVLFFIGVSRIYFNVHYLTDVVAGWALGSAVALGSKFLTEKRK